MTTTVHELPFVPAIPRGHEVAAITFAMDGNGKSPTLVFDRTAQAVYCPDELSGALQQDPATAVRDPVAVVTRWAWTVKSTTQGLCVGALIASKRSGAGGTDTKTLLVLEPAAAPYR